jgi:tetratricopeptide (TPR) repeat protein
LEKIIKKILSKQKGRFSMSTNLLRLAEQYRLKGDYPNAVDCFQEAINQLEAGGKEQDRVWAWAHKGEAHSALAQSLNDLNPNQTEHFNQALYCFNQAVGLKNDNFNQPTIKLPDEVLHNCTYTWALAHRGETLRVHANVWRSWNKPQRYDQAVKCFNRAVALNPRDAWAHAHLGAAICNARAWVRLEKGKDNYDLKEERQEHYDIAMGHLDRALELKKQNYPWCLAYKGVIYLQLEAETEALYAFLAAAYQDRNIFNFETVISPPWEFPIKRSRGMRYVMATVLYMLAKHKAPRTLEQEAYERYFEAGRFYNTFWSTKSKANLSKMQASILQKAREAAEKIKPGEPDEDKYYILAGLLALESELQRSDWQEDIQDALIDLKRILDDAVDEAEVDGKEHELKSLLNECEQIQDHFSSMLLQPIHLDEQKVNNALELLEQALKQAKKNGGRLLEDSIKAMARSDRSWYYLRDDLRFIRLTAHAEQQGH